MYNARAWPLSSGKRDASGLQMTGDHHSEAAVAAIRLRAMTGAALVVARGFVVRVIGFASYVVVARFVSPDEFGVFAFGASIVTAGGFLSDAGMAAALVRQPEEPEYADLRAVQGLQLAVSGSFAALAILLGALIGGSGLVVAVMVVSLPIATLRVPAMTLLERHLDYKPLVAVEVAETLAYSIFVTAAVVAGAGVWGLGLAVVVRAIFGTIALTRVGPVGFVLPSFDPGRVRPILRFGTKFQALGAIGVANEQIYNPAVTLIAGVGALGIWGMAYRLMQLPQLIFISLRRVSYPAMARLIGAGDDLRATVERSARLAAVGSGLVLVPLVGCSSALVPLVFGHRWAEAADILPGLCLGLMIGGPVSVAVAAYLLAANHAGVVLRSAILRVVTMLAVALSLLPIIGVVAMGLGYAAAAIVEAVVLGRAAALSLDARLGRALAPSCFSAIGAGAAGWVLTTALGVNLGSCVLGGVVSFSLFGGALWILSHDALMDAVQLLRQLSNRRSGDQLRQQPSAAG
jgi:O-antigen/teichoic acid export membrane protein